MTLYAETYVRLALTQSGDRYVYGAKESASDPSPKSHGGAFDCSGLVAWAVRRAGGEIPDGSEQQYEWCRNHGKAVSVSQALKTRGALLFLGSPATEHVVINLGNGLTIEARGAAYGVGSWSSTRNAWTAAALVPGFTYGQPPHPPAPSGYAFVVHLQAAAGMPKSQQDGKWGPMTDAAVKKYQGRYNNPHVAAIQRVIGVTPDGDWGTHTQAAFAAARRRYYGK